MQLSISTLYNYRLRASKCRTENSQAVYRFLQLCIFFFRIIYQFYVGSMFLIRRLNLARSCTARPPLIILSPTSRSWCYPATSASAFSSFFTRHLHHHHSLAHILFSVINTCPYHFNLRSCTSVDISSTFVVALIHNSVQLGDSTHPLPLTMNTFNISEVIETHGSIRVNQPDTATPNKQSAGGYLRLPMFV